jgi:purine-binding chemotaxis protein CheW
LRNALSGEPAHVVIAPDHLVTFRLDGRRCAVISSAVAEILAAVAVRPLPGQPRYIAGVIDVRGTVVPLLDLRVRFGLPSRPPELSDHYIVTHARERVLALWVDQVEGFERCDPAAWQAARGLIAGDRSLSGVALLDDGLVTIHDVGAFAEQCERDAVFASAAR